MLLSSAIKEENDVLSVDLTNATDAACSLLENSLHISRAQVIQNGLYFEELTVTNFQNQPCKIDLNLNFDADFRDIFEVRGMNRLLQPEKATTTTSDGRIRFSYQGKDQIKRETEIIFSSNQYLKINQKSATLSLSLSPGRNYKLEYTIRFKSAEQFLNSAEPPASNFSEIKKNIKEVVLKNKSMFAQVSTDNEMFNRWINRSMTDLQCLLAQTTHGLYPYAGVPWYNTAFGRDGIITAMEVLWLAPAVARDALLFLADTQATELDPSTDAEPGKIIHEMRSGQMANTREVPFKQYYGTIDATPLFLMLAGMYHRWTGDKATIQRIWPNIKAAIGWINVYGDLDGDGFVEYQHKAANGLTNQGWKDSHDSI
ncbi:MAG TPA: glycogen debranching N-terminal domain-containing protein, partial [Flavisolibacter sp.]|nr:glycogen debranching N-terminal domain-containing protein [Flavisolibacter sp.]